MNIFESNDHIKIEATRDEVRILHNALNEILNGIDVPEFSTRVGAEPQEVIAIMKALRTHL